MSRLWRKWSKVKDSYIYMFVMIDVGVLLRTCFMTYYSRDAYKSQQILWLYVLWYGTSAKFRSFWINENDENMINIDSTQFYNKHDARAVKRISFQRQARVEVQKNNEHVIHTREIHCHCKNCKLYVRIYSKTIWGSELAKPRH